jgi:hypothetical protein
MPLEPVDCEPLPGSSGVVRLAKLTSDGAVAMSVHFDLSTSDKASRLKSLSVWEESLTTAISARELMNDPHKKYELGLSLSVSAIRDLSVVIQEEPIRQFINLDVVWDRDIRIGAEGHAGITGLFRQPDYSRIHYKAMRAKLAKIARPFLLEP